MYKTAFTNSVNEASLLKATNPNFQQHKPYKNNECACR